MKLLLLLLNILLLFKLNESKLCNYISKIKYNELSKQYPEHSSKFDVLSNIPLPIWVTDRDNNAFNNMKTALDNCGDLLNTFIIYALPNKDCEAGFSSSGTNKNSNDYINYITEMNKILNNRKAILIMEPDAIALSMDGSCGIQYDYIGNLKNAINILSSNSNIELYIDVGYWVVIYGEDKIKEVINIINQIDPSKKIKGISLNLSNYRSNNEMINACKRFKDFSGYNCIIDTSRNWNGHSSDNQWCNLLTAGIGELPVEKPAESIDYYLWLKPQSELDGSCIGFSNSYQVNKNAGEFDLEFLLKLWNQGNPEIQKC